MNDSEHAPPEHAPPEHAPSEHVPSEHAPSDSTSPDNGAWLGSLKCWPYFGQHHTENRHKTHFYWDGNIIIGVKGMLFCVHKSILSRHSKEILDRFNNLRSRGIPGSTDRVELEEEDSYKFGCLLDVIYKGATLKQPLDFRFHIAVIELARKYKMAGIETNFQERLLDRLPTSAKAAFTALHPG
ncbi:hypothetical protein FRC12_010912 [Ceratobasidium sp. 428]|nr:hypothetical protein FRC12_010912 [Ceratobasidium sp. 428]